MRAGHAMESVVIRNATDDKPTTVHELVSRAIGGRPAATAICHGHSAISYQSLDDRSDRLAHYLQAIGIAPRSVVAVCLDRSIEQIVTMLAILKAGSAFLVLDPADPADRTLAIADDAQASIIITDTRHAGRFPQEHAIVLVNADAERIADSPRMQPLPRVDTEDLAYIVYTSGSTGKPNGVEITHGNLLNFIHWTNEAFDISERDRTSYMISLAFDVAVSEIWPYLVAGAEISIVEEAVRASPELLRRWLLREKITIATVPMPHAEVLLAADWPVDTVIRLVLTGGDVLRAYPQRALPFDLINNYGPSECTIVSTAGRVPVRVNDADMQGLPTIGKPISGVRIHILDGDQRPVRDGKEGEIWIGGKGVGRGYHDRPELTLQRFRPDIFGPDPAGRLYRSGDRGVRLPSGEIDFRGRIDRQTKIRGVRIELDEVAMGLQRYPSVASAVVTVHEDDAGDRQLVAYVVPTAGFDGTGSGAERTRTPSAEELRVFLLGFLPRNYVPGSYIALDAMPLTRNGKIDYDALPSADLIAQVVHEGERRMPATPTETHLARIIEGVLGKQGITAEDDFFLNGGHSILATQVVIQSSDAFGVDMSLLDLFETPTIAGLAAKIEKRIDEKIGAMTPQEIEVQLSHTAS